MIFDPCKSQRKLWIFVCIRKVIVDVQEARRTFPHTPRLRRSQSRCFVIGRQSLVIRRNQIATLFFRNRRKVILPRIREQTVRTFLIKPLQLPMTQHENAAQHELGDALRKFLGVCECQC